jgi:hypothetical protein
MPFAYARKEAIDPFDQPIRMPLQVRCDRENRVSKLGMPQVKKGPFFDHWEDLAKRFNAD